MVTDPYPVPIEAQTTYAVARIEPDPARPFGRTLYLDGVECSYVDLADPKHLEFTYIQRFADVIGLTGPSRITYLGGGGFTLPRFVAHLWPAIRQVVYEYDPLLVELVRRELALRTSANLRVKVGDARVKMRRRADDSADVVIGDAFVGKQVPGPLATAEFVREVHRVLSPAGIYALNVIDAPPFAFSRSEAAVLLGEFTHLMLLTDPDVLRGRESGNLVFVASSDPLPFDELARRAARGPLPDRAVDREGVERFAGDARPHVDQGRL